MRRLTLAAALAGLALGGCAQSKSSKLGEGPEAQPVGMVPIPSIHDTINRGANPSVAKATLPDPSNPNWSGLPLIPRRPETGLAPKVATSDGATAPAAAPGPAPTRWSEPPREMSAPALSPVAEASGAEAAPAAAALPDLPPAAEAEPAAFPSPAEPSQESEAPAPAASITPAHAPADAGGDPLLGPNPELMPAVEPAAGDNSPALPEMTPAPAPGAALEPAPASPALEPAPAPSTASLPPAPKADAAVRQIAATSAPLGADVDDANWKEAGRAAARVGDEVITLGELVYAVKETVRKQGGKASELPREQQNLVAMHVLAALIERSLMVQEAKHQLKNSDKQLAKLQETADKVWREQELPPLLRQHFVEDEHQLKRKFAEENRSLDTLRQNFRQEFIAYAFMQQKLGGKVEVSLPEMLAYYNQHMNDKENYRSPAIVWREILVEKHRHPSPADARKKVDDLLGRLRRGEDFAALAAAESESPSRIKAAGGLMETAPGGYVVEAVNAAIEKLPLNSVSEVIEGPNSYHILRVESRRAGGPATFAELQDPIRNALRAEKTEAERRTLVSSLRKKTVITTIFDGTESDPNRIGR